MPDPVGTALTELPDRIDFLEARLAHRDRAHRDTREMARERA
jgi:serine O-acetyltransferase